MEMQRALIICCPVILSAMPLPQFQPMLLGRARDPFSHPEWLYEIKWDGFRALAYADKLWVCRLVSRNGNQSHWREKYLRVTSRPVAIRSQRCSAAA
jgi:hypothetical protein